MSERQPFTLASPLGGTIHGVLDLPEAPGPRPTVLDCHGFKSFMEWGFHPYLADLLAARGFTVVRFSFTSSGMRPGDDLVTDLDAFATTTFGNDVEEIQAVLAALAGGRLAAGRVDADRMALLGHSRGGGTSILTASADPWRHQLKALVTWAAVGTFDRLTEQEKDQWRQHGSMPVVNGRTNQQLRLDLSILDDGAARRADYDLEAAAGRVEAPWLLLHGDNDETVPVAEARSLAAASGKLELEIIPEGNHTFGAQHPFVGPTPHLTQVMNATQTWLRRHLAD